MKPFFISLAYIPCLVLLQVFRSIGKQFINKIGIVGAVLACIGGVKLYYGSDGNQLIKIGAIMLIPWVLMFLSEYVIKKLYNSFWNVWVPVFLKHPALQRITGIKIVVPQPENTDTDKESTDQENASADDQENPSNRKTEADKEIILDFFAGTSNIEQVKKRYRDLVKIYHPDTAGGSTEYTDMINMQYEKEKKKYAESASEKN